MVFREICKESDIDARGLACGMLDGRRVVVCRVGEQVFAMGGVCPHERAFLDEGALDGFLLYCPLHYSAFDVRTGEVVAPPADRNLEWFPAKVVDHTVLVDLEADARDQAEAASPASLPGAGVGDGAPVPRNRLARIFLFLEVSPRVARATDVTHGWISRARARALASRLGTTALDALHGRIGLGHPLHPAATDLPIGLWLAASVADLWAGHEQVALVLGSLGTAGAVVAIASGIADWSVCDGKDRRIGFVHGSTNLLAFALQGAALFARATDRRELALGFGLASVLLVIAAAYLGGHLVLGRGVMVDRTAWELGPLDWARAVSLEELESGGGVARIVEGRKVLVVRTDRALVALDGTCSHAGATLACSPGNPEVVECPLHGSVFRVCDGRPLRGPATFPQPLLETRVADGWVEVRARRGS